MNSQKFMFIFLPKQETAADYENKCTSSGYCAFMLVFVGNLKWKFEKEIFPNMTTLARHLFKSI